MEKVSTKREILEAALELFSVQGFEATSISQIAEAVGIRKASLYSHFANKQAILDALVDDVLEKYSAHSIFANANWDNPEFTKNYEHITPDAAAQMICGQMRYIIRDEYISRARKMLVIEQFQNPQMAKLQSKQNYSDVMQYFTGLVRYLAKTGRLAGDDSELLAAQLCLPITVWIGVCDREPERVEELVALAERHILHFFETYGR